MKRDTLHVSARNMTWQRKANKNLLPSIYTKISISIIFLFGFAYCKNPKMNLCSKHKLTIIRVFLFDELKQKCWVTFNRNGLTGTFFFLYYIIFRNFFEIEIFQRFCTTIFFCVNCLKDICLRHLRLHCKKKSYIWTIKIILKTSMNIICFKLK